MADIPERHFPNRAFNKVTNRLRSCARPSKNLKADPFPNQTLLEYSYHIYSNIDVTTRNSCQGINNKEASLFQAGPSNSELCSARQQLLAQEFSDKKEYEFPFR